MTLPILSKDRQHAVLRYTFLGRGLGYCTATIALGDTTAAGTVELATQEASTQVEDTTVEDTAEAATAALVTAAENQQH